jgi:hypothetical protein
MMMRLNMKTTMIKNHALNPVRTAEKPFSLSASQPSRLSQPQFGYGPQTDNSGIYLLAGLSVLLGIPMTIGAAVFSFANIPPVSQAVKTVQKASQKASSAAEFKAQLLEQMPTFEAGLQYIDAPLYQELKAAGVFDTQKIDATVDAHWPLFQKYLSTSSSSSKSREEQLTNLLMEISPDKASAIQAKGKAEKLAAALDKIENLTTTRTGARIMTTVMGALFLLILISGVQDYFSSKSPKPE